MLPSIAVSPDACVAAIPSAHVGKDAAFGFGPEDERVQCLRAGDAHMLCEREYGGGDGHGRMDDAAQMRVVEIEHVGAHGVHQRGVERIELFAAPEHRRLGVAGKRLHAGEQSVDGHVATAAQRAAEPVENRAGGFMAYGNRNVGELRGNEETRELLCDGIHGRLHPSVLRKDR